MTTSGEISMTTEDRKNPYVNKREEKEKTCEENRKRGHT
jgi:hypothetical protein